MQKCIWLGEEVCAFDIYDPIQRIVLDKELEIKVRAASKKNELLCPFCNEPVIFRMRDVKKENHTLLIRTIMVSENVPIMKKQKNILKEYLFLRDTLRECIQIIKLDINLIHMGSYILIFILRMIREIKWL